MLRCLHTYHHRYSPSPSPPPRDLKSPLLVSAFISYLQIYHRLVQVGKTWLCSGSSQRNLLTMGLMQEVMRPRNLACCGEHKLRMRTILLRSRICSYVIMMAIRYYAAMDSNLRVYHLNDIHGTCKRWGVASTVGGHYFAAS